MARRCGASDNMIACLSGVRIVSSEVCITEKCADGWAVAFNMEHASVRHLLSCSLLWYFLIICMTVQILMEDIGTQEIYEISDLLEMNYPPQIKITVQSIPTSVDSGPLCLLVEGLNKELIFKIYPGIQSFSIKKVFVN